jgi:DNA invertase Pin-like site-specific DNA recombinase
MSDDKQDHDTDTIYSKTITTHNDRSTRQMLAVKLSSIRSMMLDGSTNNEIMSALDIRQRTFYRFHG